MPEKFVKNHIHLKPDVCTCGSINIEETDLESLRHEIVDIPPLEPQVTEYVQYFFQCKDNGEPLHHCNIYYLVQKLL